MREVSKEKLNEVEKEYLNNPSNTIARRALVKSRMSFISRVNEQNRIYKKYVLN